MEHNRAAAFVSRTKKEWEHAPYGAPARTCVACDAAMRQRPPMVRFEVVKPRARKVFALVALAFGVAGISGTSEGCRTATQVELVVTYDGKCSDLQEVAFIIGTDRGTAEASTPAPISRKRASRLASAGAARAATRSKARTA